MSSSQEFSQSHEQSNPQPQQARIDLLRNVDSDVLLLMIQDEEQSDDVCQPDGRIPVDVLTRIDDMLGVPSHQVHDVVTTAVMHRQIDDETTGRLIVGEPEMFVDEEFFFHGVHEDETVDILNDPEHPEEGLHVIERLPRIVLYFSRDTDEGEEYYQARYGSVVSLEKVVDIPDDWTDVVKEVYDHSISRLQTESFIDAGRRGRREIFNALCRDAEDRLQVLIHHEVPVDVETDRMYHFVFDEQGTYTHDLVRGDDPDDYLIGFGVIRRVVYLELGGFEAYGFPPVDDLTYGEGAPFLVIEGADPDDDDTVSLIPVAAIKSVSYMDEASNTAEE